MDRRDITELRGIGKKTGDLFRKLGVNTVEDLLHYYPRGYDAYEQPKEIGNLVPERMGAVLVRLPKTPDVVRYGRMPVATVTVNDERADGAKESLTLVWFNMPWMKKQLHAGQQYVFRGRVTRKRGRLTMEQPEVFTPEGYRAVADTMVPVYSQTKGLGNKAIQRTVQEAWNSMGTSPAEYLPDALLEKHKLMGYAASLERIHFPKNRAELTEARKRLVFDEFFLFSLSARLLRGAGEAQRSYYPFTASDGSPDILKKLPFALTDAQEKVLAEIRGDLSSGHIMKRLLQGDVGSGKTVIAALALYEAVKNRYQGALMAPTEVLARQHYESLTSLFQGCDHPVRIDLLTGSMKAKEKREVYERIRNHETDIVIGTHALIQDKVEYSCLALVITDEQHRFGVSQRAHLEEKGGAPHVLVMSATPIPRTLAVILYGDLDISVIDHLPAKRLPIKNAVVGTEYRENAYRFIAKEARAGHQSYIICPMVEPGELQDVENVTDYSEMLEEKFKTSGIRVGCLHGQMKPEEKNRVMEEFAEGKIQVLVSTTVIEVGINVPSATVMMIENAERFGLAQLHQLRGRVGRGDAQSYCIMVNTGDEEAMKRLEILKNSDDGFFIASEDLRLRGPGDIFGLRQTGEMQFHLADIYADADLLQEASEEARRLADEDPALTGEGHEALHTMFEEYLADRFAELNL